MTRSVKIIFLTGILILVGFLFCTVSYADENKTGLVNSFNLHLRESPNTDSKILKDLSEGAKVDITGTSDNWYKVDYDGISGWVAAKYITLKESDNKTVGSGVINGDDVRIRGGASLSHKIIGMLDKGDEIGLISRTGDWFRVKTPDGTTGWVFKDYISIEKQIVARGIKDVIPEVIDQGEEDEGDSSLRSEIVEYAKEFLGVKYVYGGTTPKGFDCSGFVRYVFKKFGVDLERVASDQARQGTAVKRSELKPGDLLFFDTDGGHSNVSHVGIYIGGGKFIHASSNRSRHKVTITALDSTYSRLFLKAKNILD